MFLMAVTQPSASERQQRNDEEQFKTNQNTKRNYSLITN